MCGAELKTFTLRKLECFTTQAFALNPLAWNDRIGPRPYEKMKVRTHTATSESSSFPMYIQNGCRRCTRIRRPSHPSSRAPGTVIECLVHTDLSLQTLVVEKKALPRLLLCLAGQRQARPRTESCERLFD